MLDDSKDIEECLSILPLEDMIYPLESELITTSTQYSTTGVA